MVLNSTQKKVLANICLKIANSFFSRDLDGDTEGDFL